MAKRDDLTPGFSRADLHVHTTYSDGTASPEDVLNYYALHSDVSVFAITDHDTIDGARHAQRFAEEHPDLFGHLDVIVGEEISSREGHVVGLFLEQWIPPGLPAAETIEAIHEQGGLAVAAHPYTSWMKFAGLMGVGDLIQSLPFDAVETRNANFTEVFANRRAERRAGSLASLGCSDGHFLDAIGRCFTEFPGTGAGDLRKAIEEKTTHARGTCYGPLTLARFVFDRVRRGEWIVPRRHRVRRESQGGELEIRIHEESSLEAAVLAPVGRIDAAAMPEMKETLTLLTAAKVSVILDLGGVHFLGSPGVTALVAGLKSARQNGVGFCLAKLSTPCIQTLSAARLLSVFPRARDVGEARRLVGTEALAAAEA